MVASFAGKIRRRFQNVPRLFLGAGFDLSTEQGRSEQREAQLLATSITLAAMRVVSFAVNIISISILYQHLDPVRFGLWLTITSIWLLMSQTGDLGTGAGIVNEVAQASGRGTPEEQRAITATAMVMLAAIAAGVLVLSLSLAGFLPWGSLFQITDSTIESDFRIAVAVVGTSVSFTIVTSLAQCVQRGLQRGYQAYVWQSGGLLMTLATLAIVAPQVSDLGTVALAFFAPAVVIALLANLVFFGVQARDIAPAPSRFAMSRAHSIGNIGIAAFGLQVISSITFFSDPILLSMLLGPERVAELAIPARLFNMVTLAVSVVTIPLWPAYAEAIARGDMIWAKRTLRRSIIVAIVASSLASGFIVMFHETLIRLWVGPSFALNIWIIVGLACWCVMESFSGAITMFLNAAQKFRLQLGLAVLLLFASLGLRSLAALWLGPTGIPYATLTAYGLVVLLPILILMPRIIRELESRNSSHKPD